MDLRDQPTYSIAEAASYVHLSASTLRSWCLGQHYRTARGKRRRFERVIDPADPGPPVRLSFVNLVEAYVLRAIRRCHRLPLQRIRTAIEYLQGHLGSTRPLAERAFETDGIDLFVEQCGVLVSASEHGQAALRDVLSPYLRRIRRAADGLPKQFYPLTRQLDLEVVSEQPKLIVIDPRLASGRPVIAGTGIAVAVVAERHKAGESIHELADDYGREEAEIEEVLRLVSAA